ncbi:glycine betaine ABC transporter substrate-binding protein [Tautonia marina]|uniref:glycine betaine ABC transporter substrate-binding protein n=1 Tax=Tautonia marina TaxID=2653855 RepID=UPI0012610BA2|nr:glycine betaine ABC transporter substrate-binding protein [Tautonia marina]
MRWRRTPFGSLLAVAAAISAGCGNSDDSVTILCKDFAEQAILAEMAAELLREAEVPVSQVQAVPDSYQAQAFLREGTVDLMVDYSGTALNFLGELNVSGDSTIAQARKQYAPIGIDWLDPLGFDNGYALLVPSVRAAAMGLRSIDDLADRSRFPEGVRVTCPPEYLRRPGDGLGALSEAYGFQLAAPPLVLDNVLDRMRALETRQVDVAIGFSTDGVIRSLGLRMLDDSRNFFPSYEAAFVARHETIERRPEIKEALGRLSGLLDEATMRRLNAEVEIKGRRPASVAREFLLEQQLIADSSRFGQIPARPRLTLALADRDEFYELQARAMVAIRETFPDRSVGEDRVEEPVDAVARGQARLALLGAERFFTLPDDANGEDAPPDRETRIEAAAVVGTRLVHVVRRRSEQGDAPADPLSGRVGVPPIGSGAALVAQSLLDDGQEPDASGDPATLLDAVRNGQLDVAILVLPVGDLELPEGAGEELELQSLANWLSPSRALRAPFLRPARIAAGSYEGQPEPVETLGVQVLLAGPSRRAVALTANSGPAAALTVTGLPLEPDQVQALATATGVPEAPDPTLPSAWSRQPPAPDPTLSIASAILSTVLNILAIAFLIWVIRIATQVTPSPSTVPVPPPA